MKRASTPSVTIAVIALMLAACGPSSQPASLDAARAYLSKGDHQAATVELRNLLQADPSSGEARLLLGTAFLASGEFSAAEIELRKARNLNQSDARAVPPLARAILGQQRETDVIGQFGALDLKDSAAQDDLDSTLAAALSRLGQKEQATRLVERVLQRSPNNAPAALISARLMATAGRVDEALGLVDRVLNSDRGNADAWLALAELLLYGKGDIDKAKLAYQEVLARRSRDAAAHTALVSIALARKDLSGTTAAMDAMAKALPGHPQTAFMRAQIAFVNGDNSGARDLLAQLLNNAPDNVLLLQLAGAIELNLNSLTQSATHLNKALKLAPESSVARRLLAHVYLRRGEASKAKQVLDANMVRNASDIETLTLMAEAHLQVGDAKAAEELFTRAVKVKPDDPSVRTSLALTKLARGESAAALAELRSISASDKGTLADMALISAQMRNKDFDGALRSIDELARKDPKAAKSDELRGRVLLAKRDLAGARRSFEQAQRKDPVFFPAISGLAAIDVAEGKPDQAEKRFVDLLKADPKNAGAYSALARLKIRNGGGKAEIGKLLESAAQASPNDPTLRLLHVNHLSENRDFKEALAAAKAGVEAAPNSPEMLDALGRMQLLAGDTNQAISTFKKVATILPKSPLPQLRLADAYLLSKDYAGAERSFRGALDIAPDQLNAQRGLTLLYLREKRPEKALEFAKKMQKNYPSDANGYLLEGAVYIELKDWDSAIKAYRAGLTKSPLGAVSERLYKLLLASKGPEEALRFSSDWAKQHPEDTQFTTFLGVNALKSQDYLAAEKYFSEAVNTNPRNSTAMNNLAWVKAKLGKPGSSALAEKAVALTPRDPAMLDTLAFTLSAEEQYPKAIQASRLAVFIAPDEPMYRLTLAKIYARSGDKTAARSEIEQIVKLNPSAAKQTEVSELLKSISQ